ncbi:DUF5018 domain-containing protein [Bacteroides heparinolyticus]|uniref:DUF5018 domain-containing protein n=1 Tax=Prevotella heparinolytica TaxID=28113 RepID=UPI0023F6A03D|nr:DUF5018 domain-containing protein [Bacteroides heparinolyticus]MCI6212221.1 DUF5018 domain-containing protein [Bacteroides heparinolyticus]
MKKNILLFTLSVFVLLIGLSACHSPEELDPAIEKKGINNFIASFVDDDRDENIFESEIDYEKHVITVVFPYNYPRLSDNVLQVSDLKKIRVKAYVDNNIYITPSLLYMDMTQENTITVKGLSGSVNYKVVPEIRKSNECAITKFSLPSLGLSGIINEEAKTISLITLEEIGEALAEVGISHGAVLSPDPTTVALNYDNEPQIKVTAQNGTSVAVYTVKKKIPEKIPAGIRTNSAKLIWVRKLTDIGLTAANMTTGIAVTKDYVVLNERGNSKAVYVNAKTGENAGSINISQFAGSLTNFYATADDADNILFVNLTPNGGSAFTVWRVKGVNGTPEKYIEFPTTAPMGRKISVSGSLDGDAIITAPYYSTAGKFARWQVVNGQLKSQTPENVTAQGLGSWGNNADVIYSDPSNPESDYFAAFYSTPRNLTWFNGATNTIKANGPAISANWIQNAVDFAVFNKVAYVLSNSVNSFTWGKDDNIYLFDVAGGTLGNQPLDFGTNGLNIMGNYGGNALGVQNANGTGDVALRVSPDGYYLYIYFMFTNGYVGCISCDCIDM